MKMNKLRAEELLTPLKNGSAKGISDAWKDRLIEALEYVIENEFCPTPATPDGAIVPLEEATDKYIDELADGTFYGTPRR